MSSSFGQTSLLVMRTAVRHDLRMLALQRSVYYCVGLQVLWQRRLLRRCLQFWSASASALLGQHLASNHGCISCCAELCHAVLCCVVLCCVMLRCTVPCSCFLTCFCSRCSCKLLLLLQLQCITAESSHSVVLYLQSNAPPFLLVV